ncbi:MAG TPA: DUF6438 domain-containing protein [Saprospiraceae bacterium]|nr:DUF6438 domain-containing protein [Saprospiraceae bacterium]
MRVIYFGMILIGMVRCSVSKGMDSSEQPIVEMRTTSCFGKCPVYHLQIFGDRNMVFGGEYNVDRIGDFKKRLSERQYQFILDEFDRLDFAHMKAVYDAPVSDLPATYITFRPPFVKEKTVKARYDYPIELSQLIAMLQNLAMNPEGWTPVQPDTTSREISDHLIIHLQPSVDVSAFTATYAAQGLHVVKAINALDNLHLFAFTPDSVDPETFLQQIRHDDRVIHAEYDHKLELRR